MSVHTGPGQDEITELIEACKAYYTRSRGGEVRLNKAESRLRRLVADLAYAVNQSDAPSGQKGEA